MRTPHAPPVHPQRSIRRDIGIYVVWDGGGPDMAIQRSSAPGYHPKYPLKGRKMDQITGK
jgi:hypothetical protein